MRLFRHQTFAKTHPPCEGIKIGRPPRADFGGRPLPTTELTGDSLGRDHQMIASSTTVSPAFERTELVDAIAGAYRRMSDTRPSHEVVRQLRSACAVLGRPAAYSSATYLVAHQTKRRALAAIRGRYGWSGDPAFTSAAPAQQQSNRLNNSNTD